MQNYFYELADHCFNSLLNSEVLLFNFSGERSDFCRFNHNKIRQPGFVDDAKISMRLIDGSKHATYSVALCHDVDEDKKHLVESLVALRKTIKELPEDPHLMYSRDVRSSESIEEDHLLSGEEMTTRIMKTAEGLDLVGILATGGVYVGFANSLGQKNWFEKYLFNFDFSAYYHGDKAVKSSYVGKVWDDDEFAAKIKDVRTSLDVLKREAKTIEPGEYNVYLSPAALSEIFSIVGWGGFGEKGIRSKTTSLLKLVAGEEALHEGVFISENQKDGMAPGFDSAGFRVAPKVALIENGKFKGSLISPRSAKEFSLEPNSGGEAPQSLDVSAGDVEHDQILDMLGTGIYINNLWYLNYSDRTSCRLTGMTRFACFWVENGKMVAPLNVMRFDESFYRMLGSKLIGLTKEREFIADPSTYGGRELGSAHLPGAIIKNFKFTL